MGNESNTFQEVQFVFRRLSEALRIGGKEVDARTWLAVVIPVVLIGIAYVVWMYVRDSRSVSAGWAIFLGALRITVYLLLAWVFLLPAWQTWDRTENRSKV